MGHFGYCDNSTQQAVTNFKRCGNQANACYLEAALMTFAVKAEVEVQLKHCD
jgi:hypothetical protein